MLDKLGTSDERDWYAARSVQHGWSRGSLTTHIAGRLRDRIGTAPDNFAATIPAKHTDAVRELVQDPLRLDFLSLDPGYSERDLEDALVQHLVHLIAELGHGFAFVGRQVPLKVGRTELFLDLLFYHLGLRRYVVFELKVRAVGPGDVGQLATYVSIVDDLLRMPDKGDEPTVGILLATDRDEVVVQYALRATGAPMAVTTFTTEAELAAELRPELPSAKDLTRLVQATRHDRSEAR